MQECAARIVCPSLDTSLPSTEWKRLFLFVPPFAANGRKCAVCWGLFSEAD